MLHNYYSDQDNWENSPVEEPEVVVSMVQVVEKDKRVQIDQNKTTGPAWDKSPKVAVPDFDLVTEEAKQKPSQVLTQPKSNFFNSKKNVNKEELSKKEIPNTSNRFDTLIGQDTEDTETQQKQSKPRVKTQRKKWVNCPSHQTIITTVSQQIQGIFTEERKPEVKMTYQSQRKRPEHKTNFRSFRYIMNQPRNHPGDITQSSSTLSSAWTERAKATSKFTNSRKTNLKKDEDSQKN